MIKLHNFRVGFATNSSSSHSVILLPSHETVAPIEENDFGPDDQFGWSHFRLVSEESKLRYLAAQFFGNFSRDIETQKKVAARFDREIDGFSNVYDFDGRAVKSSYSDEIFMEKTFPTVDHQSAYNFAKFDPEILDRLIEFFKSPRIVVLGGNDNSDVHPNEVPDAETLRAFEKLMTDGAAVRVKVEDQYWSMFNVENGTKARISLDPDAPAYEKSKTPELVDVKITDYCARGCNFCYQSSTKAGQHGRFEDIVRIFDMLSAMEVFEVAIGGGEPTDHPDFVRILEAATERNIKPNFTTLSNRWLVDPEVVAAVKKHVGGIGVSCTDKKGLALVEEIEAAMRGAPWSNVAVTAQHVLGSVPLPVTADFLDTAFDNRIGVLLLGFKEVGFGIDYNRFDDESTEVVIKMCIDAAKANTRWPRLSVDTALIDRYPALPGILGAPDALVTSPEGKFSCYVDAVTNLMGASSYVVPSEMTPLPLTVEEFKEQYARY